MLLFILILFLTVVLIDITIVFTIVIIFKILLSNSRIPSTLLIIPSLYLGYSFFNRGNLLRLIYYIY